MKKVPVTVTKQDYVILNDLSLSHTHQNIGWVGAFLATCEEKHLVCKNKKTYIGILLTCIIIMIYKKCPLLF